MTQLETRDTESRSINQRDVEVLARAILRSRGIELFDDPRTPTQVAQDLGYLTIQHTDSDPTVQVTTL